MLNKLYIYIYKKLTKRQTDLHALNGIRIQNHSKRAAADPRLRHRGHRDRLCVRNRWTKLWWIL